MEKNDNSTSSIRRISTSSRVGGSMESPTLNDDSCSTTPTERVCRVSNPNDLV